MPPSVAEGGSFEQVVVVSVDRTQKAREAAYLHKSGPELESGVEIPTSFKVPTSTGAATPFRAPTSGGASTPPEVLTSAGVESIPFEPERRRLQP